MLSLRYEGFGSSYVYISFGPTHIRAEWGTPPTHGKAWQWVKPLIDSVASFISSLAICGLVEQKSHQAFVRGTSRSSALQAA
jgi:hypothetical protein